MRKQPIWWKWFDKNRLDIHTHIPCCPVLNVTRVFFSSCSTTKGLNDDVSTTTYMERRAQLHRNERSMRGEKRRGEEKDAKENDKIWEEKRGEEKGAKEYERRRMGIRMERRGGRWKEVWEEERGEEKGKHGKVNEGRLNDRWEEENERKQGIITILKAREKRSELEDNSG